MSGFWTSEDKIPIEQKKVTVPAEHGLSYSPGQKIEFHIPASIGFFQPKESYLKFDVKLSGQDAGTLGENTRLQLDGALGGQVLIKDLRVYSGGSGRILLEEYQNYNVLTGVKYDYESNDSIRAKRALTEGCVLHSDATRSTLGVAKDSQNNISTNPYFPAIPAQVEEQKFENASYQNVKCLLPLNTGIFSNDKIFPVAMTEGLIVEIILEDANRCVKMLDTTNRHRKLFANPLFLSSNGTNDTVAEVADPNAIPQYPTASNASAFSQFFVRRDNLTGVNASVGTSNFPFSVGEEVTFVNGSTGQVNPSIANGSVSLGATPPKIAKIEYLGGARNCIKVTLEGAAVAGGATGVYRPEFAMTKDMFVVSAASERATLKPSYAISDCEFICQQVTMPPGYTSKLSSMMKSGGSMNYDFLSYRNYKISQTAGEVVATLRLPLTESRAKSVLCVPTNAIVAQDSQYMSGRGMYAEDMECNALFASTWMRNYSNRTGIAGIADGLTQYQMFYDGRLNPNRKVVCSKTSSRVSIDAQPLIELEKALVMGGITPYSLMPFRKNFVVGRALSLQSGVYDARGKDFQLQLEYTGTGAQVPEFNKLWNCWVSHIRTIQIRGDSIQLIT